MKRTRSRNGRRCRVGFAVGGLHPQRCERGLSSVRVRWSSPTPGTLFSSLIEHIADPRTRAVGAIGGTLGAGRALGWDPKAWRAITEWRIPERVQMFPGLGANHAGRSARHSKNPLQDRHRWSPLSARSPSAVS